MIRRRSVKFVYVRRPLSTLSRELTPFTGIGAGFTDTTSNSGRTAGVCVWPIAAEAQPAATSSKLPPRSNLRVERCAMTSSFHSLSEYDVRIPACVHLSHVAAHPPKATDLSLQ